MSWECKREWYPPFHQGGERLHPGALHQLDLKLVEDYPSVFSLDGDAKSRWVAPTRGNHVGLLVAVTQQKATPSLAHNSIKETCVLIVGSFLRTDDRRRCST